MRFYCKQRCFWSPEAISYEEGRVYELVERRLEAFKEMDFLKYFQPLEAVPKADPETPVESRGDEVQLIDMSKGELLSLARQKGLEVDGRNTKESIIAAIEGTPPKE